MCLPSLFLVPRTPDVVYMVPCRVLSHRCPDLSVARPLPSEWAHDVPLIVSPLFVPIFKLPMVCTLMPLSMSMFFGVGRSIGGIG